ncbi:MAG: diguanylate cyclase domain-containing protein [Sphingomonadales bacterium]
MSFRARILIVGGNSSDTAALADKLSAQSFDSVITEGPEEALAVAEKRKSDIVIMLTGAETGKSDETGLDETLALCHELTGGDPSGLPSVLLIGPPVGADKKARCFEAGVNAYLSPPYYEAQLFNRLHALVRLLTMREELELRTETTRRFGVDEVAASFSAQDDNEPRILAIIRDTSDFAMMEEMLSHEMRLTYARSPDIALDYLTRRPFDAVIINADGESEPWMLCSDIKNNSRLFSLPILIVADHHDRQSAEQPFRSGANDVVFRPVQGLELESRVRACVREARYRTAMHRIYREAKHFLTSDALTGLYSYGFALEHLAGVIEHAGEGRRNLTVGVFNVRHMAAVNAEHGYAAGDRLIRQIGNLIGTVIRGEDMAARIGGQEFCVILPDTDPEGARIVIDRIAGVVNSTEYLVPGCDSQMTIRLKSGSTMFEPGDTPDKILARARNNMK